MTRNYSLLKKVGATALVLTEMMTMTGMSGKMQVRALGPNGNAATVQQGAIIKIGQLTYKVTGLAEQGGFGELVLTETDEDIKVAEIPEKIEANGKRYVVKEIGDYAFAMLRKLRKSKAAGNAEEYRSICI